MKTATYEELQERVRVAIREESGRPHAGPMRHLVEYSVFETIKHPSPGHDGAADQLWMVTDNLDDVAVKGDAVFTAGGFYLTPRITDPTWLDVVLIANRYLNVTGDHHHIYLERISEDKNGRYELHFGS